MSGQNEINHYLKSANSFPEMERPEPENLSQDGLRKQFLSKHQSSVVVRRGAERQKAYQGAALSRSDSDVLTWSVPNSAIQATDSQQVPPQSVVRFRRHLDEEADLINNYYGWNGIIEPEYNLLEPYTLLDTEAYFFRAIRRKQSLMFRNGFALTGTNRTVLDYCNRRMNQVAYVSGEHTEHWLKSILWNLLICSNAILIKVRDEEVSGGRRSPKNGDRTPVAGYLLIPPYSIYPYLNGKGRISKWRRFFGDGRHFRDYRPEDVIHFKWDCKPGHIFGTPRTASVRDDIFALRRLEENVELLLVHHLFPLVHIRVGTKEKPCEYYPDGTSEITYYSNMLQNMPKEGILVTDERVEVKIQGSGNQGVDFAPAIEHYKERVKVGLGVSGVDLGETDTANRSTADNVSQNLKDEIKADLEDFCGQFRMEILKEWLSEAAFGVNIQSALQDIGLVFSDIDPEGQIRNETNAVNLYNNNAITHPELRQRIKSRPLTEKEEKELNFSRQVLALEEFRGRAKEQAAENNNQTAPARTIRAAVQPSNQHGENLDPHKARSSREMVNLLYDKLSLALDESGPNFEKWPLYSQEVLSAFFGDEKLDKIQKKCWIGKQVALTTDKDMLYALLRSSIPAALDAASPPQPDEENSTT